MNKERVDWEVCWIVPGGSLKTKRVAGYNRARQEASNLRYKMREVPGVRIWITREF